MNETRNATAGESVGEGVDAIRRWYEQQLTNPDHRSGFSVEDAEDAAVWMTFDLRATALAGRTVEAFVEDRGSDRWLQGWCDGDRLSLAVSQGSLGFALMFLEQVMSGDDGLPAD